MVESDCFGFLETFLKCQKWDKRDVLLAQNFWTIF